MSDAPRLEPLDLGMNGTVVRQSDGKVIATMNLRGLDLTTAFLYARTFIDAVDAALKETTDD